MSEKTEIRTGNIGFVGLLQIVFITLKLCNVIDWSWWWVLSPLLLSCGLVLLLLFTFAVVIIMSLND